MILLPLFSSGPISSCHYSLTAKTTADKLKSAAKLLGQLTARTHFSFVSFTSSMHTSECATCETLLHRQLTPNITHCS
ncbi:hypothetical protein QL285_091712 [Trifolium repens]|nr:hypothetical protein QL285_091712 [Trifolium repens]